jgi:hypothetical protein
MIYFQCFYFPDCLEILLLIKSASNPIIMMIIEKINNITVVSVRLTLMISRVRDINVIPKIMKNPGMNTRRGLNNIEILNIKRKKL